MTDKPQVSIVLPTYNGAGYLAQSVQSCLEQTYAPIELIVVDDGSTDHTPAVIQSFKDPRLRYVRLERNQGHIAALNQGFALSRGEFLTWTSDDNYYAPQALAVMAEALIRDKHIGFVYTQYYVVDEHNHIQRLGRSENPSYLDVDNCIGGCFLYRRKVYEVVGDFNPEAFLAEDYEYWLRVRQKFRMKKIDQPLYYYRLHDHSLTGTYKEEKVQVQVQKIRDRFIPKWKKFYWRFFSIRCHP
ncbi:MAG: glycosyltransferase family 2 protein, partial [Candidatus Omnitrophica bacterium]|nr:glycosyltransferase family 2 protein [Candidatus Omnitrophota bacterium]